MLSTQDEFDASFEKYKRKPKVDLSYEEYDPKADEVKISATKAQPVREESADVAATQEIDLDEFLLDEMLDDEVEEVASKATPSPVVKAAPKKKKVKKEKAVTEAKSVRKREAREPKERKSFGVFIRDFFAHAGIGEYLVIFTTLVILIVGAITLSLWSENKDVEAGVESLIPIGEQLAEVATHTDVFVDNIVSSYYGGQEANKVLERLDESVEISATFNSIMQDLKVKFVNKETDELITGIQFKVEIIPPSGEEDMFTVTDEDKDGMIYVRDLEAGTYQVVCKSIGDVKFTTTPTDVVVKDELEYQEINIINEAKTEAEINVAEEDTEERELEVEDKLEDTVAWITSTKTAVGDGSGYVEVDKTTITDPSTVAMLFTAFNKVDGVVYNVTGQNSATHGAAFTVSFDAAQLDLQAGETVNYAWTIDGVDQANDNINLSIIAADYGADPGFGNTSTMTIVCTVTCSNSDKSGSATSSVTVNSAEAAPTLDSVTLDKGNTTFAPGDWTQVTATGNYSNGTESTDVTWSEVDGANTSFETNYAGANIIQVAAKDGATDGATVTLTATSNVDNTKTATITFTIDKGDIKVTLDKTEETIVRPNTLQLTATVENEAADDSVTWSTSDEEIATVDANGLVTPVGGGTATITCTTVEKKDDGASATATCAVTVSSIEIDLSSSAGSDSPADIYIGDSVDLTATFTNRLEDDTIGWMTSDATVGTITKKTESTTKDVYTFEAIKEGTVTITVYSAEGLGDDKGQAVATYQFKVIQNPRTDTTTKLVDNAGTQIYVKDGSDYRQATSADYYTATNFYVEGAVEYTYTGWQTLSDNNTYFFDRDGDKVTGTQVIQGVEYIFSASGILSMGDGVIGIDVSKWNGDIDWTAVKNSGVDFVIIRCGYRGYTQGTLVIDPYFESNIREATAAGLKVGVYFFTQAITEVEAVEEASLALALTQNYDLAYPIFIDVESSGGRADSLSVSDRTAIVKAFCQTITNAGERAGIYANKSWLNGKLDMSSLNAYTVWLAQYNTSVTYTGKYDMWQYSDSGHIGGISGNVDMNRSYVNY